MNTKTCLVCGITNDDPVCKGGWMLAPNRVGGYTCSKACDDVILAYDEQKKAEQKAAKKAKKENNRE